MSADSLKVLKRLTAYLHPYTVNFQFFQVISKGLLVKVSGACKPGLIM